MSVTSANENSLKMNEPNLSSNEGIREHMVDTAVKFLISPKILGFDEEKKVSFLEKKGLTKAEIEASLKKSQTLIPVTSTYQYQNDAVPQYQLARLPNLQPPAIPPRRSFWSLIRESANILIFISGIACGFRYLYKYYIGPYLTGRKPKSSEDNLLEVQHSIMSLLQQIQVTLEKMDSNLSGNNQILKEFTDSENIIHSMKTPAMEDVQKELNNIKGLLINKKSFPASPQVTPAIPHWQRITINEEAMCTGNVKDNAKVHINGNLSEATNEISNQETESDLSLEDSSTAATDEVLGS